MDAIRVGEFVSQSKENADFGEHIADELSEALVLQGIAIRRVAPVGIKGDFTVGINQQTGLMKVTVRGTTTDRTKAVLVAFSRSLLQNEGDLQPVNEP